MDNLEQLIKTISEKDWQRHNIFMTIVNYENEECKMIINGGSTQIFVSNKLIEQPYLKVERKDPY